MLTRAAEAQRSASARGSNEALPPAIAALTNRRAEATPITLAEREQRVERARKLLVDNKLGALVITTGTSLRYFTGLTWGQSERFFCWALPAKGAP